MQMFLQVLAKHKLKWIVQHGNQVRNICWLWTNPSIFTFPVFSFFECTHRRGNELSDVNN